MKKLWLKNTDIPTLTSISGNIDVDSLLPHIDTAQKTVLKRVLTLDLYNYFDSKIQNGDNLSNLSEPYKTIFEEYVVNMLVYYSAANYMGFGGYKTANSGVYKQTADNAQIVDFKEVAILIKRYEALGASVELQFYEYMKTQNIPEFKQKNSCDESNVIGWY